MVKIMEEPKLVKELRETHCKGCLNEHSPRKCTACNVLDCWLRRTYLEKGVYSEAAKYDIVTKMSDNISSEINKKIINQMKDTIF